MISFWDKFFLFCFNIFVGCLVVIMYIFMYMDNIFKYLLVIFFYWESCLFEFLNELKRGVELGG